MISNAFSWSLSCQKVVMATAVNLLFTKPHLKNIPDQSYLSNCCCLPHYHKLLQKVFLKTVKNNCCRVTLSHCF